MEKLNIKTERDKNEIAVSFYVKNKLINIIVLKWLDEDEANEAEREYLLLQYHGFNSDPVILNQGHLIE